MRASDETFSVSTAPSDEALSKAFDMTVTDASLDTAKFGDLVKAGEYDICITVLLRHFHCGECQQYVMQINEITSPESLKTQGVQLIFIGSGDPRDIRGYNDLTGNQFATYASPPKDLYATLGMTRNLSLGNDKPSYVKRSFASNFVWSLGNMIKMRSFVDLPNISQHGGELIFARDGSVLYTHRMANSRGHTESKELLEKAGVSVT